MAEENKKVEEAQTDSENAEAEGSEETPKKKANILVIAAIVLGVILISLVGYFIISGNSEKEEEVAQEVVAPTPSIFFPLPEMIVSLSGNSSNIRYLKLVVSLELATAEDQAVVETQLPKIIDEFQTYLRQLRLEDLRNSIGTYRLKEALLLRVNQVVQPVQAKEVLLKEMLVQ